MKTNKKRKIWILSILGTVIFALVIVGVVLYFSQYNLKRFLSQWESETEIEMISVLYESEIYYPKNEVVSLYDFSLNPTEIICVENGRVYYFDQSYVESNEGELTTMIQLQSIKTDGSDLRSHGSFPVLNTETFYVSNCNTIINYPKEKFINKYKYLNHRIYFKSGAECKCFDIESDTFVDVSQFPDEEPYTTFIKNDSITFYHQDGSVAAELTLDHMAEINSYAESLLDFKRIDTVFGEGLLDEFFQKTYSFNGKMYVVCRVASMSGFYSAGIIFQYDIETDTLSYVSHAFPTSRLLPAYSIVPFTE